MAPTTERDFSLLPPEKQRLYRQLQAVHMHGSPDGPWFFLIAQSDVRKRAYRLIGITDTSMLRPQVFALQQGTATIGFAASEKQAIDAVLESLSQEDARFWSRADLYWNARGGSHTDGGAFIFTVQGAEPGNTVLQCVDKFGRVIEPDPTRHPLNTHSTDGHPAVRQKANLQSLLQQELTAKELFEQLCQRMPALDYDGVQAFL